jgi:putative transposase
MRHGQPSPKSPSKKGDVPTRSPSSRRYPPEVRQRAVEMILAGSKRREVAQQIGCSEESLRLWVNAAKATLRSSESTKPTNGRRPATSRSPSTAPKDPGAGLSALEEQAILELKKRHPSMGPAQIRAQLKRFKGWRLGVRSIARVLRNHGYELEHRSGRPQEATPPTRWEAPRRNALWQIDFTEVRIPEGRRALGVILDDFSRFIVHVALLESPTSEDVVAMMKEAIRRHGKPEAIYTDRAGPFLAWGKEGSLQRFLERELIDHHVCAAYHPQGRGKVEAVLKTVKRELWEIEHFASEEEARAALGCFVLHYNHRRAHIGLDGLTPADRFFGRWEAVLAAVQAESRKRQGAAVLQGRARLTEELPPRERAELLRLMVVDGELELRFFGHRIPLGRVES